MITFIKISNNANFENDTEKFVLVYKILPGTLFNASFACVPFMRQNTVEIKSWESSFNSYTRRFSLLALCYYSIF